MNKIDFKLQLREMQDICTLACEKFAAGDKVGDICASSWDKDGHKKLFCYWY